MAARPQADAGQRALFKDDALIRMTYRGIRRLPPDLIARMERGESVDLADYYVRIAPMFGTAAAWLRNGWRSRAVVGSNPVHHADHLHLHGQALERTSAVASGTGGAVATAMSLGGWGDSRSTMQPTQLQATANIRQVSSYMADI
jgi:hypothetical protein